MPTIAKVVLLTFTWLLIYPTVLAAQTPLPPPPPAQSPAASPETELAGTLATLETTLTRLQARLTRSESRGPEDQELAHLRQRLIDLDQRVHANFDQIAQHLQDHGLPAEILQRHQAMVATYEQELATLRAHLDALATASAPTTRQEKAAQALQHLQSKPSRHPHKRLDPHQLPFRGPDGTVRPPKERQEEFESALVAPQSVLVASVTLLPGLLAGAQAVTLPALSTPEDLAPTEDVPLIAELQALAASLNNNPVQIYHWVHDHIAFLPTYGSIQGAQMTLQTKRGNAFDTASLLIALLRTAHIPARYVYGTVQIPIAQVMNGVGGVTDPEAALQLLGQGGIPSTGLVQGGVLTAVKLEHIWVEAWVDFRPSRGAMHREGDVWVPLDAAFKQYQYMAGMNIQSQVSFDVQGLVNQITATTQINEAEGWVAGIDQTLIQNALAKYQAQVNTYVAAQKPNATVGDILGTKTIILAHRPVLAAGLPYQVVVRGNLWTVLPETLRHAFRFTLYTTALDQLSDISVVSLTQSLPMLAGKKVTLSFAPASQADADLLGSFLPHPPANGSPLDLTALPTSLPGYLIHLVAELRVEGAVVARGGTLTMGQALVSISSFYDPVSGWQEIENTPPIAGEYRAVAVDVAGIAGSQVQRLSDKLTATKAKLEAGQLTPLMADDLTGELLYGTAVSYFAANDITGRLSADTAGMIEYRWPSFGSFTAKVQPHLLFGIPRTVSFPGLELDITRLDSVVVSKTNHRDARLAYIRQSGLRQSTLEHLIPEKVFTDAAHPGETVSAVKALAMASRQGQRIYTITLDNIASVLPQLNIAHDVQAEIQEAVATGKHALVSQHNVTVGTWTGVGYIIVDPRPVQAPTR